MIKVNFGTKQNPVWRTVQHILKKENKYYE